MRSSIAVAALLAAALPSNARAQTPAGYDEGIIAVVARDLPPLTLVVLADSSGRFLVPLIRIADMVGLTVQRPDSAHLLIPRSDDGVTTVDLIARTITGGAATDAYAPAEMIPANGDIFVTTERLAQLLQAEATLDAGTLTLVLTRDPLFPAQQLLQIEQRRALLVARDRASTASPTIHVPYRPASGVGVVDWELTSGTLDPTRLLQLRAHAGAAVYGGSLTFGGTTYVGRDRERQNVDHDVTMRYHRAFPDARYVTQFEAGDIITGGLFARFIRGAQLTNAPLQRGYELGEIMLRPDLPAGWQYEVLQNGKLIGFSDAVSRDAVAVPLHTGSSPVTIRMYGPGGQQFESALLYQTPTTLLPRGRFEYAVSAGECSGGVCDEFAQLDTRLGKWTRATVGAGAEYLADSTGSALRPYALASFTTGTFMTGEVQVMPDAVYRGTFALYPIDAGTGIISAGLSEPGYGRVTPLPNTHSRWDVDATWDQRLDKSIGPFRSIRAGIGGSGLTDGSFTRTRFSLASALQAGYAEARIEKSELNTDLFSVRMSKLLASEDFPGFIRSFTRRIMSDGLREYLRTHVPGGVRPLVDGGIGIERRGLSLLHAGIAAQHERFGSISTGLEWVRGNDRPRFSLSWTRSFGAMQAVVRAVSDPNGVASSSFSVRGAVSATHNGRILTGPLAREGYGGVHGTVFLDRDGDGLYGPGDERVPTALIIGDARVDTDDEGNFQASGLLPYSALAIRIDSTSAGNPGWITAEPRLFTRPVPNTSIRFDIALMETREVTGTIIAGPGITTVAGVTIEIVAADSAADPAAATAATAGAGGDSAQVLFTTSTFSDGQFYLSRVAPGRYRVRVAASSLAALDARSEPAYLEMTVPRTGSDIVELPPLTLTRKSD